MQRQHLALIAVAVLAVGFVLANNTPPSLMMRDSVSGSAPSMAVMAPSFMEMPAEYGVKNADLYERTMMNDESASTTAANVEQKVIKTADLELKVVAADESVTKLTSLALAQGGFVASSSVNEDANGDKRGYITLRVPVEKFESTIQDAKALAEKVISESTNGQDVTEQFTDLTARLGAAQAQEAQYLVILQSAKNVTEILAVQVHLADTRAEIESLQGQITYLENRTSLSTINVTLVEETRVSIPTGKFELGEEISLAANMLVVTLQRIATAVIWLVVVAGPFLVLALIGYAIARQRRGKK